MLPKRIRSVPDRLDTSLTLNLPASGGHGGVGRSGPLAAVLHQATLPAGQSPPAATYLASGDAVGVPAPPTSPAAGGGGPHRAQVTRRRPLRWTEWIGR